MIPPIFYRSPLYDLSNQTFDWMPSDSEVTFYKNLKTKKNTLEEHGWITKKFTYKINSHGFRCKEFEQDQENIVFLGCSHTMGIGMPVEEIWPTLVADKLKLKCYNLGIGGASNDTAFRLGSYYIPKLKPKLVVLLSPDADRFELFDKDQNLIQYGPWVVDKFYKNWAWQKENSRINEQKNTLALRQICESMNIKFLKFDLDQMIILDLARDLQHFGTKTHQQFSKLVLREIKSNRRLHSE